jgi:hypothetical protein
LEKGSLTTYYLELNREEVLGYLLTDYPVKYPEDLSLYKSSEILYIDILVESGGKIYDVYMSKGASHWGLLWEEYKRLWSLRSSLSPLIVGSVGGFPWDSDIILISCAILKLLLAMGPDMVAIVVGDGLVRDELYDMVLRLGDISRFDTLSEVYLYHLKNSLGRMDRRIYYFGGLPSTFMRYLNVKSIKNIEWMLKTLPTKVKRSTSLIEDLTHLYPLVLGEEGEYVGEA